MDFDKKSFYGQYVDLSNVKLKNPIEFNDYQKAFLKEYAQMRTEQYENRIKCSDCRKHVERKKGITKCRQHRKE